MKLTLIRHAQSESMSPDGTDLARALNARGGAQATEIGQWLSKQGVAFDWTIASNAVRVRQTVSGIAERCELPMPSWDRALYLAEPETLIDAVRGTPVGCHDVLLVAHNPGIASLCARLANERAPTHFPPATLARFDVATTDWAGLSSATTQLETLRFSDD